MTEAAGSEGHPAIDPGEWAAALQSGERLLWTGRPEPGLDFRKTSLVESLVGIGFIGIAIVWFVSTGAVVSEGRARGPGWINAILPYLGLVFLAIGLYLLVGHFFWKAWVRRQSRYALSDRRAFIATNLFRRSLASYPFTRWMPLELEPGTPGTVWFADEEKRGTNGQRYIARYGFECIADAAQVHRMIDEMRRAL